MELERNDIERIVRLVIAEYLRLADPSQTRSAASSTEEGRAGLVLYAATSEGLTPAWEQLRLLEEQGYSLTHVLPSEVAHWVSPEHLRKELPLPPERLIAGAAAENLDFQESYQLVVVATLTWAEAAKVAGVQPDTCLSNLVCQALWKGCPVVAAQDGVIRNAAPIHPRGSALREAIEGHLQKWRAYGAQVAPVSELAAVVREASPQAAAAPDPADPIGPDREVITAAEMEKVTRELVVSRYAIITPLAQDLARARGIAIRREGE